MNSPVTKEDLERLLNLQPFAHKGFELGYVYADPTHPTWQGCVDSTIKHLARLKDQGFDVSTVPFFRRVKNPEQYDKPYFQLDDFKWRKEYKTLKSGSKWIFSFDPMLSSEKNTQKTERSRSLRQSNQLIRRFYATGSMDALIHCPIYPEINIDRQIKRGKLIYNLADAHHLVCWENESIQKVGEDPGKLNSCTDLMDPSASKSRLVIEDMMRTVFLSRTGHHFVHHWTQSDINSYDVHELPWTLRDKWNYNTFTGYLVGLGYKPFPSYESWIETLTLGYHGKDIDDDQYMKPESKV